MIRVPRYEDNRLGTDNGSLISDRDFAFAFENKEELIESWMAINRRGLAGLEKLCHSFDRICDVAREKHPELNAGAGKWLSVGESTNVHDEGL